MAHQQNCPAEPSQLFRNIVFMCSKANNIVNRFHQRGDIYQETGINYSERATLVLYFNRSRVSSKFRKIELTEKFRFDVKMIADNPG